MTLYRLTHKEDPFNTYLYAGKTPRQALANMFVDWQKANPKLDYPVKPQDWHIEEDAPTAEEAPSKRLEEMNTKELAALHQEAVNLQNYLQLLLVEHIGGKSKETTKRLKNLRPNLPKEYLL